MEESVFDLSPEQLDRLLSIGTDGTDLTENEEHNEQAHDRGTRPLDRKSSSAESRSEDTNASLAEVVEQTGGWIGQYKLLSVLGEGGMGIVYLAEQERPIKRRVALKVIKPGMDSKRVITRFEAERQALAFLDHPNIAHVHDAGTTQTGRPYFVMEYVQGVPITDFCDHHKLTLKDRLHLFIQICQAVQHAHQKGIIHRDIKPSNILISTEDDKASPKIIDFGVAKAISQPLTERTHRTEESQMLGTPEYMSPEQADMAKEDIDTRSDVYSLGVLLYVLLTGVLPFDPQTLRDSGIENIRRTIRETDPKTPSTRLTSLGEEATKVAERRSTEISTLAKNLKKELEWIPLKAMRKERTERYRSVSELADDVENYLNGIPLIAGPPGTGYKVKKFVRRNRTVLAAIAAVVAVFAGGLIVSGVFAIEKIRLKAEANAISDFLTGPVIKALNPYTSRKETTVSILDTISERLEGKLEDTPLVEAEIRHHLGRAYWRLGQLDAAEEHLKRGLQVEKIPKNKVPPMSALGHVYRDQGRLHEAELQHRKAWEWGRRLLGGEHINTLWCMNGLALAYREQKRYEEAESLYLEMIEISRRVFGEDHVKSSLLFTGNLANTYKKQGRYDDAERLLLRMLELQPDIVHYQQPETTGSMQLLATIYAEQERYDEAESIFLKVLENRRIERGDAHRDTLRTFQTIGNFYKDQQRYEKAEPLMLRAVWGRRITLGDEHPDTLEAWNSLIDLYEAWNKPEKAEEWRAKLPKDRRVKLHISRRRGHDALGTRGRDARDTKANRRREKN